MSTFITQLTERPEVFAISMSVLHSLWQAIVIAAVLKLVLSYADSSVKRYWAAAMAVLVMILCSVFTFYYYLDFGPQGASGVTAVADITTAPILSIDIGQNSMVASWSPIVFTSWMVGVLVFFIKILGSITYLQFLKQGSYSHRLSSALEAVANQMNYRGNATIKESGRVNTPMVVGIIKPVILFPIGLVNMLTTVEVEAILAHELAHIQRHDYLVNMLQVTVEALYFFNPAMWWIHNVIREEREACCDEVAIETGVSASIYAHTLLKLEETRASYSPSLAMTFIKHEKQLLNRVKRIMNISPTNRTMKARSLTTVFLMTVVVIFSSSVLIGKSKTSDDKVKSLTSAIDRIPELRAKENILLGQRPHLDTLPQNRSSVTIHTKTNDKDIQLKKENGKITELIIDGKLIPEEEYDDYAEITDDVMIFRSPQGGNMMIFGDEEGTSQFKFDQMFDNSKIEEMMKNFRGNDFAFPQMEDLGDWMEGFEGQFEFDEDRLEKMQEMMEGFRGQMGEFRFDTLIQLGPNRFPGDLEDGQIRLFSEEEESHFLPWGAEANESKKVVNVLGNELNRDGLLEPYKENQVELTGKHLKINGDKQPKNIWGKYKRIYEEQTGMLMSKKTRVDFSVEGKKSSRKIRSF